MPRDSSGNYTPPINSFYPAQANTDIDPNDWNETVADIAGGISGSAAKDFSNATPGAMQAVAAAAAPLVPPIVVGATPFAATGGTTLRSAADRANDAPSIFEFGLPGLVADWAPLFTQALATGREYLCPAILFDGLVVPYTMATPVNTVPARGSKLKGEGRGTVIAPTFGNADYFYLGAANSDTWDVILEGFNFQPTVQQAPGFYAVHFKRANQCYAVDNLLGSLETYDNVIGSSKINAGYFFEQFGLCGVLGGDICGTPGDAITIEGDLADEAYGAEFLVDQQLSIVGCGTAIHLAGSAGGVYLDRINIGGCALGIRASVANSGQPNRELFTSMKCTVDSCPGMGVSIEANSLYQWLGDGIWVGACGGPGVPGVNLAPSPGADANTSVHLGMIHLTNCYWDGWVQAQGFFVAKVFALQNGAGGDPVVPGTPAAGGHAFNFLAGTDEVVIDGLADDNGNATRGYGAFFDATIPVVDARVSGPSNGQGAAMCNGAGGNGGVNSARRFHNTSGFSSRTNGYAAIPQGQSSVTVNHGLNGYPTSVNIGPASDQDSGVRFWAAPANFSNTGFTILYSEPAASLRAFSWEACRE